MTKLNNCRSGAGRKSARRWIFMLGLCLMVMTSIAGAGEFVIFAWPQDQGVYLPLDISVIDIIVDAPNNPTLTDIYFYKVIPVECNFNIAFSASGASASAAGGNVNVLIQNPNHPLG